MVKVDVQGGLKRFGEYEREKAELKERFERMDIHEFLHEIRKLSDRDLRLLLSSGIRGDRWKIASHELYMRRLGPTLEKYDHHGIRKRRSRK
jgi:hypothetical protein